MRQIGMEMKGKFMNEQRVSLTPGFSQVTKAHRQQLNRFGGFLWRPAKPLRFPIAAAVLLTFGYATLAATNDPAMALQKGLFEEEANHDLSAAIRAYQTVIKQFDQDRKLAATAVFRLGECYRKQGNTNDANAQYERVIREFPDQTPLVTLSRSYLTVSGQVMATNITPPTNAASEESDEVRRIQAMIKDSPDLINAVNSSGQTPLHRAAEQGQVIVATFLLDNGAEVDPKDKNGQTPLHLAAGLGHTDMVELLLAHKADVQAKCNVFTTPTALHIAVEKGLRTLVELLLAHKADVNARTGSGPTPLHIAAVRGFKVVAEVLIRNGADVNAVSSNFSFPPPGNTGGTPLNIAAQRGDIALAELLLANKANPNAKMETSETPLHTAATYGHEGIAKLLIDHGAEVNARSKNGATPLIFAISHQNTPVARVLLAAHADSNIGFQLGDPSASDLERTPLYLAVANQNSDAELVRLLLERGANPNIMDASAGNTPLTEAAFRQSKEIVSLLLAANADPNTPQPGRRTALHFAVSQPSITQALLSAKAEVDAKDENGETPLHWAAGCGLKPTAELLVEHGANVNARDSIGNTPLHFAVLAGRTELVDFLLTKGADPNIPNQSGQTPLDWSKTGLGNPSAATWIYIPGKASFLRPYRPTRPGSGPVPVGGSVNPGTQLRDEIASALKSHGALENLPHLDRIEVSRSARSYSAPVFYKGTNDWNQFTLLEAIGVEFGLLNGDPGGPGGKYDSKGAWANSVTLPFPDLAQLRIRHPEADFKTWHERKVDLSPLLNSGDCSQDVPLAWGEVIEIPEADHPLNGRWAGFSDAELTNLVKCLSRQVTVVIKDRVTKLTVVPEVEFYTGPKVSESDPNASLVTAPKIHTKAPLWLKPALQRSNLLLASSDLSHIKVTRRDPASGQKREWVLDCSDGKPAPEFWLRDGDVIEVPEKP